MAWIWLAIIVVSVLIEMLTPGNLVSIWFSVGGIFALLLSALNIDMNIQILVFILISLILIILVRPLTTNYFRGNIVRTNCDALIGRHTKVTKAILPNEKGEVKINGNIWYAIDVDNGTIIEDELVTILAIDGVKLVVRKAN